MAVPQERLRAHEARRPAAAAVAVGVSRISWGGIWAGTLVALGALLILTVLGLAIGISAVDIGQGATVDPSAVGIGAAVWAGLSLLVALLIGGMVASRVGVVIDRTTATVQGALVWVLVVFAMIYLASSGLGMLAGGAFAVVGGLVRGAGAVAGAAGVGDLASGDVDQILANLDDPQTVQTVAAATGMSADEARSALGDIRQRVEAAREDPAQATAAARQGLQQLLAGTGQQLTQAAQKAEPYAVTTAWTTLGVMILALAAAIGGAIVGSSSAGTHIREAATPAAE